MDSLNTPTGAYDSPPTGQLPVACPRCGSRLEQFLQAPSVAVPAMPPLPEMLEQFGHPAPPSIETPIPAEPEPEKLFTAVNYSTEHLTLFVYLRGQDYQRHRRCITSLISTDGLQRVSLRVICSGVPQQTLGLLRELTLEKLTARTPPLSKYQEMRLAFTEDPPNTDWIAWLDDTAWFKRKDWLSVLMSTIDWQDTGERVGAVGNKLSHMLPVSHRLDPRQWFQSRPWFHNVSFRTNRGVEAPNGNCIHYLASSFFALSQKAIKDCRIPDEGLKETGGDIVIGEQLHQNGFKLKSFNSDGRYVHDAQPINQRVEVYPWLTA